MTTQAANNESFEKELNKTELGQVINNNKGLFISLFLAVVVAIIGTGVYKHLDEKSEKAAAIAAFEFESNLTTYSEKKIDAAKLASLFNELKAAHSGKKAIVLSGFKAFDALTKNGAHTEALSIVDGMKSSNDFSTILIEMRRAAALEDLGKTDEAIKALELVNANQLKIMQGKLFLDLGRLYMAKGDKTKAKEYLQKVEATTTQKVFKSLASYYLNSL